MTRGNPRRSIDMSECGVEGFLESRRAMEIATFRERQHGLGVDDYEGIDEAMMIEAQTHRRFVKTHLPVDALVFSPDRKSVV